MHMRMPQLTLSSVLPSFQRQESLLVMGTASVAKDIVRIVERLGEEEDELLGIQLRDVLVPWRHFRESIP